MHAAQQIPAILTAARRGNYRKALEKFRRHAVVTDLQGRAEGDGKLIVCYVQHSCDKREVVNGIAGERESRALHTVRDQLLLRSGELVKATTDCMPENRHERLLILLSLVIHRLLVGQRVYKL